MSSTLLAVVAFGSSAVGPISNPDDQYRFLWGTDRVSSGVRVPRVYPEMVKTGFNTLIPYLGSHLVYDTVADKPLTMPEAWHEDLRAYLDRCLADGVSVLSQFDIGRRRPICEKFPRRRKNGHANVSNLDAANPRARDACARAAGAAARSLARHPAVVGVHVESEIRDGSHPSFTPEMAAAYRRDSGRGIPEEVLKSPSMDGRQPPHWKTIPGFPDDRVVDDEFPVLDFYVWTWRKGDGWNDWISAAAKAATEEIGPKAISMYDPSLRTPPLWGAVGDVSVFNNWTYPYPEPYGISYEVSRQNSRARLQRQNVWAMIQAISYRSQIAPIGVRPPGEPVWAANFPKSRYPTTPPDLVREAMWSVFARRVDGIGFHGWNALYGKSAKSASDGYCTTNPDTRCVIEEAFRAVGEPLGPLLRAVPERAPKVAVVESYASMILGARITWDCGGKFEDYGLALTAANLMPASLNEDEIRRFGVPDSVQALVMSQCDVLTRKCYERLVAFKKRGGRIFADSELCPALTADAALPPIVRAFPETKSDHDEGNGEVVSTADAREMSIRAAAARLKELVGPHAAPYVDSDKADILVSVRSYRSADYVFAINDRRTYGDYVGAWKRVKEKGLPNSGTVTIGRAAGAVYDLVRHCAVPFKSDGGETLVNVCFATNDGRLLLVAPRPLAPLSISATADGEVVVKSSDKDVMIPIEVVCDGEKPRYGVVEGGVWKRPYKSGANLRVRNLADGRIAVK